MRIEWLYESHENTKICDFLIFSKGCGIVRNDFCLLEAITPWACANLFLLLP